MQGSFYLKRRGGGGGEETKFPRGALLYSFNFASCDGRRTATLLRIAVSRTRNSKALSLGRLTPLCTANKSREKIRGSFTFHLSEFHVERSLHARAKMWFGPECGYINVARERRAFKGSRKCTESYGDKNTKTFPSHASLVPPLPTTRRIGVLHLRGEPSCSREIMLKIDYVADSIERRVNLVEITATIWIEARDLSANTALD